MLVIDNRETIYCIYCKEIIQRENPFIIFYEDGEWKTYHRDCYKLLTEDGEND